MTEYVGCLRSEARRRRGWARVWAGGPRSNCLGGSGSSSSSSSSKGVRGTDVASICLCSERGRPMRLAIRWGWLCRALDQRNDGTNRCGLYGGENSLIPILLLVGDASVDASVAARGKPLGLPPYLPKWFESLGQGTLAAAYLGTYLAQLHCEIGGSGPAGGLEL